MEKNKFFKNALKHHASGNWNKAKEIYEYLLKLNPNDYLVLQNYAPLLSQLREYSQAKSIFKKCLKIKPKDPLLLYNYGKFHQDRKIFEKAIKFYEESFKIEPKKNFSMYNIGNIYFQQGKFELAISSFKQSIEVNPENFLAHNNLALSYKNIGNFNDSIRSYKNAINKNKNYADLHVNYGTQLLMLENFKEGFEEYEWRKKSKSFLDYVNYNKLKIKSKLWEGENLNNKKILIIAEQGIGDLIQFSRYLYQIKKQYNTEVILYLKSKKFSHFYDKTKFNLIFEGETIPEHDYHNHLLSLLKIFLKQNNLFCKPVNFFQTNKDIQRKWNDKFKNHKGIKVGINSSTSLAKKDIPMKYFINLASNFDCKFILLQKKINSKDIENISIKKNILYFPEMDTSNEAFLDSIEIIKHLDLVITADTSIAHLAATLKKKNMDSSTACK